MLGGIFGGLTDAPKPHLLDPRQERRFLTVSPRYSLETDVFARPTPFLHGSLGVSGRALCIRGAAARASCELMVRRTVAYMSTKTPMATLSPAATKQPIAAAETACAAARFLKLSPVPKSTAAQAAGMKTLSGRKRSAVRSINRKTPPASRAENFDLPKRGRY